MNNLRNTTKIVLFASLIVAMILPFSATNMAYAQEENDDQNPRIKQLEEKIAKKEAQLEQKKTQLENETNPKKIDKLSKKINSLQEKINVLYKKLVDLSKTEKVISSEKLIKRIGEKWQSHYSSQEEFEKSQSEIEAYVSADLPKNGWNKKMVKEQIKQHNFESIIGKKGYGHELVSLFVAKQKINAKYDATGPVAKYHEWTSATYPAPDTKREINERILEIVGDAELKTFAKKMAKSLNVMAQHGNVPTALSETDSHYWMNITGAAVCMYEPDCDSDALYANAELPRTTPEQLEAIREFEKNQGIDPLTGKAMECTFFLPCADASGWKKVDKKHTVTAKVNAYTCGSTTCTFTQSQTKTGTINLDVIPSGLHRYSTAGNTNPGLKIEATSQSPDSSALNNVDGRMSIANGQASISDQGLGSASFDKYITVNTRCGGSGNCGVMNYFVESDATKWVWQP